MDIDESSNFSDMSIDLKEEAPLIKNIDEGASLEESPEYVEDIDNHLRKMEVRIFKNMANFLVLIHGRVIILTKFQN